MRLEWVSFCLSIKDFSDYYLRTKVLRKNFSSWVRRIRQSEVFFNIENILFGLSVYI